MVEHLEPGSYRIVKIAPGNVWKGVAALSEEEELKHQKRVAYRARVFKQDVAEWLVALSLGGDMSRVALHRYLPTEIYVATTDHQSEANYEIATAFSDLLIAAGFEPLEDSIPKFGSMHWKRVHRTKSRKSAQQLDERLALVEAALTKAFIGQGAQVNGVPKDRDEMKKTEAERAAELQKVYKEIEQAETEIAKAKVEIKQAGVEIEKGKAETDHIKAETELAKAETRKLDAETKKINLEAKKTFLELAHTLVKAVVKASAAFAIIIGTLHISAPPPQAAKPAIVFKIESHRGPDQANEVTGSVWLRTAEKAFGVDDKEHDPLDAD
jgi:hypothetical protein